MPIETLSQQQRDFFDTFGYLGLPGLLADSVGWIIEEFERLFQSIPHDGTQRTTYPGSFIDQSRRLCTLLDDPRIAGVCEGLLGEDFAYYGGDGNFYSGDTGWHSDVFGHLPGWPQSEIRFIKIAFYLDPLMRDSGALRVIPGSHHVGDQYKLKLESVRNSEYTLGIHGRDVPCVALETRPGDIVVFDHNTFHAAFGGNARRRMFTMNLFEQPRTEIQTSLVRMLMGHYGSEGSRKNFSPIMIETASPRRMRHLQAARSFEDHMAKCADAADAKKTAAASTTVPAAAMS